MHWVHHPGFYTFSSWKTSAVHSESVSLTSHGFNSNCMLREKPKKSIIKEQVFFNGLKINSTPHKCFNIGGTVTVHDLLPQWDNLPLHFKEEAHILSGATCSIATPSVMRISVVWLLCYKIWSFHQLLSCKSNNLWHLYGSDNQLLDRQPIPPKSIIQIQSSDQNQSKSQRSLQPDGCVVTAMKWVCGFTQGITVKSPFMGEKKKRENVFTVDNIFCAVLTDFKQKHRSETKWSFPFQQCTQVWVWCPLKSSLAVSFLWEKTRNIKLSALNFALKSARKATC